MKNIKIADVTLNKQSAWNMGFKEKLEIARSLSKAGVDVIELAEIENEKTDSLLVRTIASFAQNAAISVAVSLGSKSISAAVEALKGAAKPRLSVSMPVSVTLLEYSCKMRPDAAISAVKATVTECVSSGIEVEFCLIDSTHAERDYLKSVIEAAIASGAKIITLCDNEGLSLPAETDEFIQWVKSNVTGIEAVTLGFLCENTYGMGIAASIAALTSGASEIKVSASSRTYTPLFGLSEVLFNREGTLKLTSKINRTEIGRITQHIMRIANEKQSGGAIKTAEAEPGAVLSAGDDIKAVSKAVKKLGYELDAEDKAKVFEAFVRATVKKKTISAKELDAIVASASLEVPARYKIKSYVINSGNVMTASASIVILDEGSELSGVSLGDGPIDAAFRTIEQIIGRSYELDDFQIQSVTEGTEAMGSALVKLRRNGKIYSGQAVSTDIIGASIRAYFAAINKIVYDEAGN